ncbi:MAG: solute carrier family 23 protein, partial [Candidatus Egerieousia sp.]
MKGFIERLTGFDPKTHSYKTELLAGLTTFITMSYILAVNPAILSQSGMPKTAVFTATALTSAFTTILMSIFGKNPFAQAPGMAINAYFTYTLVKQMGYSWQTALTIMFLAGILFIIVICIDLHKFILKAIPLNLRKAITIGVGLFITFIGLQNADIVVLNNDTLVQLGTPSAKTIVAFIGIILSAVFLSKNIKGGLFLSIAICTIIGIPLGVTTIPDDFHVIS